MLTINQRNLLIITKTFLYILNIISIIVEEFRYIFAPTDDNLTIPLLNYKQLLASEDDLIIPLLNYKQLLASDDNLIIPLLIMHNCLLLQAFNFEVSCK